MKKRALPAVLAALILTGCSTGGPADAESTPTPKPTPTPTVLTVSVPTTCQFIYGTSLDGPAPKSTDIIKRFVEHPDLSTVTRDELEQTISALTTASERADPSIAKYVDAQAAPLQAMLGALKGSKDTTIDFDDYKAAGIELINQCRPHISVAPAKAPAPPADPAVPAEFTSALNKATRYANLQHMSKAGLYRQLTSEYGEKFTLEAAQYAVDNVKADWNANALSKAKSYQSRQDMSPDRIWDQLTSEYGEQFTPEEADYAIQNLGG